MSTIIYLLTVYLMKQLHEGGGMTFLSEKMNSLHAYRKSVVLGVLMLSSVAMQGQDVQIKVSPSPMVGVSIKTKKIMAGVNLELISIGDDKRRIGAGITPVVYFDEKMSGKLGPSAQLTRKFDKGAELRAIVGTHGGDLFGGIGGKVVLGGQK